MWGGLASVKVQRAARLTADAAPEPVVKGRTLTVKGKLTRATWSSGTYTGYRDQKAVLQFKADGGAYVNVRTVTSGTGGRPVHRGEGDQKRHLPLRLRRYRHHGAGRPPPVTT